MDFRLAQRLTKLAKQIKRLEIAERLSLTLDANEKILFSKLFIKILHGSIAEKTARVHASNEWQHFIEQQVKAKVDYNKMRRHYELLDKAYLAEHLTYKIEMKVIERGVE